MQLWMAVVALLAGLSSALPKNEMKNRLKHFDLKQLPKEMIMMSMPDSGFPEEESECDADLVRECVKCVHDHARLCVRDMHKIEEIVTKVQECEASGEELAEKDQAWQEASLNYHKLIGACLAGEPAPVQDSLFLSRKKRSPDHHEGHHMGHGHDHHEMGDPRDGECEHPTYELTKEDNHRCWVEMRAHRDHCNNHFRNCPKIAACLGLAEPEDEGDKAWYEYIRGVIEDKKSAIVEHKRDLLVCTDVLDEEQATPERVRAHLWGDDAE